MDSNWLDLGVSCFIFILKWTVLALLRFYWLLCCIGMVSKSYSMHIVWICWRFHSFPWCLDKENGGGFGCFKNRCTSKKPHWILNVIATHVFCSRCCPYGILQQWVNRKKIWARMRLICWMPTANITNNKIWINSAVFAWIAHHRHNFCIKYKADVCVIPRRALMNLLQSK